MLESSQPTEKDKSGYIDPGDSVYKQPDVSLLDDKQWRYVQRRYHISPRELEVAKLVCKGFVNGNIAKKLKVKPGTVKTHLKSIFGKTRARNKITLLLRFVEDVNNFFGESPSTPPIPIVDVKKPTKKTPASGEKLKKE
ncbi:MAG: response regulator transcription factor [Planctomycetota bacterium]|jgi:DNA-binding CsgD family transcriptional regulator